MTCGVCFAVGRISRWDLLQTYFIYYEVTSPIVGGTIWSYEVKGVSYGGLYICYKNAVLETSLERNGDGGF